MFRKRVKGGLMRVFHRMCPAGYEAGRHARPRKGCRVGWTSGKRRDELLRLGLGRRATREQLGITGTFRADKDKGLRDDKERDQPFD
ncbi:Hypothetical protein NTJ_05863 [Nesidiocoris tenuis]|uniref:Uncharacterized protein n=1 Tax=Nesidiocoris tenuis TaxID=355587 RepID=A0ABN7ALG0_9HEMI|nr:Hypothetical protein NTJ_05863 [Nesidiocoris tenuis]